MRTDSSVLLACDSQCLNKSVWRKVRRAMNWYAPAGMGTSHIDGGDRAGHPRAPGLPVALAAAEKAKVAPLRSGWTVEEKRCRKTLES